MPTGFLNHKRQDKQMVKEIGSYLNSCFIETWLDEEELPLGSKLKDSIYDGMNKSAYFLAFISARYLKSGWCAMELEKATSPDNKIHIIPVLMEKVDEIKDSVTDEEWSLVQDLIENNTYAVLNKYDIPETAQRIADTIWSDFPVRFQPIKKVKLNDIEAQLIHYDIPKNATVPLTLLSDWDFNIEKFISRNDGKDGAPIIDKPVIISGTAINWLLTSIVIGFYNKRDVLLYNQRDKKVVCAYTTSPNSPLKPGDVFDKDFNL